MNLIQSHSNQIAHLCRKYKVKSLYAFGSVNTDQFNAESDIDLLVDFQEIDPVDYADNYFDLKFALEDLFQRSVDLLEEKALKNPFLKQSIDQSKMQVYGQ